MYIKARDCCCLDRDKSIQGVNVVIMFMSNCNAILAWNFVLHDEQANIFTVSERLRDASM